MNSLLSNTAHIWNRSSRRSTLAALILGTSLAFTPDSAIAETYSITNKDEVYLFADNYDTGSPEGYYLDLYDENATDFSTSGIILDLANANIDTYVGYASGHTDNYAITSYATVNNRVLNVGYKTGSTGTITITDSLLTATDEMAIGVRGTGTINATHGTLNANSVNIGKCTGSTGTVNLNNTRLNVSSTLKVGIGTGHLTASNGTHIGCIDGIVANTLGARGDVTLTGAGTAWNNTYSLTVGYSDATNAGIGTILIEDDALLMVGSAGCGPLLKIFDGSAIQLNGGFFAIYGDQTADEAQFLTDAHLQVWDGTSYIDATTANTSFNYYTAGEWATGDYLYTIYGSSLNLTGYTVIASTLPEPATYALFGGFGAAALVLLRKRRG